MASTKKYIKIEKLGEGSFGLVYKAKHRDTGEIVALKTIRIEDEDVGIPPNAIREISLFKELHHPNIVRLTDLLHRERKLTLVFEYEDIDLKKYIANYGGSLTMALAKSFMYQMMKGLSFIHAHKVFHRDLKPGNLLINRKGELKIADFGLARSFDLGDKDFATEVVTLWYRSPDVLMGSTSYTTSIDIWSAGCIFTEMLNGKALFQGIDPEDQLAQIVKVLGTPDEKTWPGVSEFSGYKDLPIFPGQKIHDVVPAADEDAIDLLEDMLVCDPSLRLSSPEVLQHSFFFSKGSSTSLDRSSTLGVARTQSHE